jgi:peptide/nickel transport system permease protein
MTLRDLTRVNFVVGIACVGLIAALAIAGGLLTSHAPEQQSLLSALQPPFDWQEGYLLGTDQLGRDILARMVSGARVSLLIAVSVVAISGVIGVFVGSLSGYLGGRRDIALQKIVETFWAMPPILIAISIVALFGQNQPNLIIALTIQRWIPYARLARAQALSLRSRDFVAASSLMGGGTLWILRKHIIPNVLGSAVVIATFSMATAIIAEASLSFLGLGVPPTTPTWGGMLADARAYDTSAWWLAVFPGLGIFLTVMGLNLLGDWLRDQLDPKDEMNLV